MSSAEAGGRRITRRGFLRAAAAAPLVPLVAGLGGCGTKEKPEEKGRVLVVGGGLCGLVTLDALVKAGRGAILLEAGSRLGGRIYTVRDEKLRPGRPGFSAGLRAEMGAERVGAEHVAVRGLMDELGIATSAYPVVAEKMDLRWGKQRYRFQDVRDLPKDLLDGLSDVERAAAPLGIFDVLIQGARVPASDDARSGIEWLRSIGMTQKGEELVRAFVAIPLEGMPAPVLYRYAMRDLKASRSDTVAGGTDRIVTKLAERHAGALTRDAAIVSVRQDGRGVVVTDTKGRTFDGTAAIFCLPLTPLRGLRFDGGIPGPLAERLRALEVAHEWKEASESSDSSEPAYSFGERRVSWRMPERSGTGSFITETLRWEPDEVRQRDPGTLGGPFVWDCAGDPLIGGAYAYARSGTVFEGIVRAGRLIFAGADLSDAPGWMEGAVRAAAQAVAAVVG